MNRGTYYYRDHAHRDAKRRNRTALERAEHSFPHPEGLGFNGGFCTPPASPRPTGIDRIAQLPYWRHAARYDRSPNALVGYGSVRQEVVSPVMLP